jgi:integrase
MVLGPQPTNCQPAGRHKGLKLTPPSSPTSGATNGNGLQKENSASLYVGLVLSACSALNNAAQALNAAAIAISGMAQNNRPTAPASPLVETNYTVNLAVREFLLAKARACRSDKYLKMLRVTLRSFAGGKRGQMLLTDVTASDVEAWLHNSNWAPRTQKGYVSDVRTMYNWGIRRGLCRLNPAAAVELPQYESGPVEIHTPDQVRKALAFAVEQGDLNIVRCLAIRYFAGLRSSEAQSLSENEIKEGFIEVTAIKSKTRRRRLVTIQENLKAWLKLGGKLPLHDANTRLCRFTGDLKRKHGIEWPHNVARHSFCSYHLAKYGNAGKTALEAGHTEQMLFNHYRELVTPAQADDFFKIEPPAEKQGLQNSI